MIPDQVRYGMKNKTWYCAYMKGPANELVLERSLTK